jgi:hypothetical protein
MEKPIKFTDDELHQIKTFQEKYAQITATLGQLTLQKISLDDELSAQKSNYKVIRQSEVEFANSLTKTYGDGTINIDTGEFIPKKSNAIA